ncbi:MAG TPA: hypothetical protein ENK44_13980 [Caldithrix abyssi]|uniref:HAD family hydrolase n=1 Tax=Caldithrix abyssi TaxID=187145 RepID=A0A7V4U2I3_CALAY|nr:hypothetical protein [Caldithrix abyssi]
MRDLKYKIKQIIFDADDTLWENNIYYVQASNDFFDLIEEGGFPREDIIKAFDDLELKVVRERGYGSHNFVYILEELFRQFTKRSKNPLDRQRLEEIIRRFKAHPVNKPNLFEQVIETLKYLNHHYHLFILTKGEYNEQEGKIIRAGVADLVEKYFILPEKNDRAYLKLIEENGWKPEETCMVGNSPKSDINPALRAGMYAIYIPYTDTWKLDDEPIEDENGKLLVVERFSDLKNIF